METVLWLLSIQGMIGAFDTIYYHEWQARLPARGRNAASELKLHASRDFFYAIIFITLPWLAWHGVWAFVLGLILIVEIIITLWDFVVEKTVRKPLGDLFTGERITHGIMGILYGITLANLVPILWSWSTLPTNFVPVDYSVPNFLYWGVLLMGIGVFLSGVRDLYAALELPYGNFPWKKIIDG
jgi:phosphatidylglycerophosphate synthase